MAVRVLQVVGGSQFGGAVWVMLSYVQALQENGCDVTVCTSVERVADAFREAGCEIVSVPEMRREIHPPSDLVALVKLARICRRGDFDVVHTHTSKGGFLGRAAARLARVPIVLHTSHGFAFHESSPRSAVAFFAALERIAGRWCDRVITVSEFHRRWALELRIARPERIVTIHNGISRSRLVLTRGRREVREELGFGDSDFVLVSVGRLAAQKGLETLILALPEVLRRDARARLLLVGEGSLRSDLEGRVRAAGLAHVVDFVDFRTDIGDILNASDLMVAPSLREGLSISVLEAMAMGKPIVTTNIGSNLELIEDGVSGLLVPPEEPRKLADAILRIMAQPDAGSRYGEAARDRFERQFTEQAMQDSLWSLYRQLLLEKLPTKGRQFDTTVSDRPRARAELSATVVRPMRAEDLAVRVLQVVGGSQFGGAVWVMLSYVQALQENGCDVTVCTSVERVADAFREAGCEIVSVPEMRREIHPPSDLVALVKLARICRRGDFDVVHTHTSKGGFLGRAAARLARVPIVLHTSHGFAFHESSPRSAVAFFAALERIAGRWCDRVITVSEFHRRWALELRIAPPERIVTIHNGISRSRLVLTRGRREVREELGFGDSDFVLVSVGRLAAQKGLETLILALPEVLRRDARARLVLVGEGSLRSDLEGRVRAAGLAHVVDFVDFRTDIGDIWNASDLMVAPSLWEGLSISVLEAMAMGKPIVTTNIGSNLELIEDGVSGLLVPPDEPRKLADAILRIMAQPDAGSRYGEAARDRFERQFTEQAMQDSLWSLYRQLLLEKLPTKGRQLAKLER